MKKVLIVGDGKSPIIDKNFIDYLTVNDDYIFDILSFKEITSNKYNKIYSIPQVINNKFYRLNSLRFLFSFVVKGIRIIRKYDIVHFHMFYPGIFFLTPFFKKNVVLTLWGSDVLKSNKFKKILLGFTLKRVKTVTCTNPSFRDKIVEYYPFMSNKIEVICYMLKYIELVNSSYLNKTHSNKARIVVGSNSNTAQNHLKVLEAIGNSRLDVNSYKLIIPLTYGRGSNKYKRKISDSVKSLGCSYEIIEELLTDRGLVELRLNCELLINFQDSDQLSGAMLETLCADNIVVTGSWLNYNALKELGVKFYEVESISDLSEFLEKVDLNERPSNRKIITEEFLPQNVLCKWLKVYDAL
ncbi:glycosyltransferase [Akkermansiaceae bacterium]|nr:glycosyltransferase [Akkermansiaceae bacterium]